MTTTISSITVGHLKKQVGIVKIGNLWYSKYCIIERIPLGENGCYYQPKVMKQKTYKSQNAATRWAQRWVEQE